MTMEPGQSPIRRRRWPWVAASILAVLALAYLLAGFVLVPWLAKRELPRLVDETLHHRARIGELAFNPFTLTLRATDFALEDKAGGAVLGFSAATVDLEWRSLARRAWVFSEVRLVNPSAHVVVSRDGRLNLAALVPGGGAPASEPARFAIGRFLLENGRIDFEDQREGYRDRLERLSLDLSSLSTLDAKKGAYALVGQTPAGETLRWKGELSLAPLAASGTLALANVALAELGPYFDEVVAARIVSGRAALELPYRFALPGGKPHLTVSGAKLEVRGFELAEGKEKTPLAKIGSLVLAGVDFDSATRRASAAALRIAGAVLAAKRDANGELDLVRIFAGKADPAARAGDAKPLGWRASIAAVEIGDAAVNYADATAKTPLVLAASGLAAKLKLDAESGADGVRVRLDGGEITLARLDAGPAAAAGKAPKPSLRLAALAVAGASFDSNANALKADSVRIGTLDADAALQDGRVSLLDLAPAAGKGKPAKPFSARVKALELAGGNVTLTDRASGVALPLERISAKVSDASTDTAKPLAFAISAGVKTGGRIALRGRAVPDAGTLNAKVEASGLSLAPLQPFVVARYSGVRLVSGEASLAGTLRAGGKDSKLAYSGAASAANVVFDDAAGERLLGWKALATESLRLTLSPDRLDADEVRWTAPSGKFAIATDGTSNLSRAFAKKDAPPAAKDAGAAAAPAGEEAFAVEVRRVRMEQGALEFSDDSLSPRYVAKIYDLAGTANGLSSDHSTRSQFDFEGRVDEFGYARLSGAINAFVPRERTAFRVQLRNIDLASVSTYSVEFAGYRLASGHMSLDLNYRVRGSLIEGDNKIILDKVALGERVESPHAMRLPLELAIALLKDENGRISLELPVTGNLDDPQFSFAPIIWKAIGNFLASIITAPFRALARLFGGGSGDEGGVIAFDPGESRLLPPEREKIGRIVEVLAKRPELKLAIPARYDAEADARALKRAALGRDISRRAGFAVADTEAPGPINLEDRSTRAALRALFGERFSAAELDQLRAEAEAKARGAGATAPSVVDRVRNFAAGEPQVADAREFYQTLLRRLREAQPLPPNALAELARSRGTAIEGALHAAGADPARITQSDAQPASDAEAKQVTVQLSLSAR